MMRKQYHMCELEIMKFILSLCIPSIKHGKENYLKDDTIPHFVIKMGFEMDFSVQTLARLKWSKRKHELRYFN